MYDVTQGNNPNFANILIRDLNKVVSFLTTAGLIANFTALLNETAGTFNGVAINSIIPGYTSIHFEDLGPITSSSTGFYDFNGTSRAELNLLLLVLLMIALVMLV
jgi:hypothetical protein